MPKKPEPWWREDRKAWFVQINRKRHNLGRDKKTAWQRFHELMAQPQKQAISSESVVAIIDSFLDWTQKRRSPDTYEWYRFRPERRSQRGLRSAKGIRGSPRQRTQRAARRPSGRDIHLRLSAAGVVACHCQGS